MNTDFNPTGTPAESQSVIPPKPVNAFNNNRGNSRGRGFQAPRGRFTQRGGQRHGGTGFSKQSAPSGLTLSTRQSYFQVFTSNRGCRSLTDLVYELIVSRDRQITSLLPRYMLTYIISLSFIYRLARVAILLGYASVRDVSRLKQSVENLLIPSILCNYIESLGSVTLRSGAKVVPRTSATLEDLLNLPVEEDVETDTLEDEVPSAKRARLDEDIDQIENPPPEVPIDNAEHLYFDYRCIFGWVGCVYPLPINTPENPNPWYVSDRVIMAYNKAVVRAQRTGAKFRKVDYSTAEGKPEMIVNYTDNSYENLVTEFTPTAPEAILDSVANLGAAYRFRKDSDFWTLADGNYLLKGRTFTGTPSNVDLTFSELTLASFGPHQEQH